MSYYAKAVVNPGESFVGTSLDSSKDWTDWTKVIAKLRKMNKKMNNDGIEYDNFPIRSYPQTEVFTVVNLDGNFRDKYAVGETFEGTIIVTNNSDIDFNDDTEIELVLTIGPEEKEMSVGKIGAFKSKEEKEFTYHYTITEKDAAKGELTSTVKLLFNGEEIGDTLFDYALTFTIPVVDAGSSVDGADDTNPATGVSDNFGLLAVCALTAGAALVVKKRKK